MEKHKTIKKKDIPSIAISLESSEIDIAIEKAKRLKELLQEVRSLIDSLGQKLI